MPFKPVDPKPDFPKLEEEILKFWEDNKIFEKSLKQTEAGKPYTFYDGPPFATGTPHYGHILGSTVKDLFPRYQTMKGRFVRRRWGWDCHGLPIEEIVERELGISGKKDIEKLGIKKFNETCRSMVLEYVAEWRKTIRKIARWIDFDNSYKTMDRDYMESVWWAFKQIYDKGLIYEGRRVLLYCPRCETPVSNFEVAMDNSYQTVTEESVTVKFPISNDQFPNTYFLAWTTTPWTLPGNLALAVGPNIKYQVVSIKDKSEVYILAADLVPKILNTKYEILDTILGSDLVGLEYEPLFEVKGIKGDKGSRAHKVYAADFVNTEEGTGIVHTAVVYGEDDYNFGLKVGLPVVPLLDEKGLFNEKAPKFLHGQYFKHAEKMIKQDLETRNLLFEKKPHTHSYPHCWRCGTALFYNAIPAWFINIQKIKKDLLESNKKEINWYPQHLKRGRYQKSVEAAPDWNISRNRYWGNPIAVWKCKVCGHNTVIGSIKDLGLAKNIFYFSRHGEAEHNVKNINSSYPETFVNNLTAKGVERARGLANWLSENGGVDMIFTSDLLRTRQTAETVGKILDVPVESDARLREFNVGVYNGRDTSDFERVFPFEERWHKAPQGGETNLQAQSRMVDFITEVNQKHQGKKILVISHGDPLHMLTKYFGSQLSYPKYATIFELDVSIADLHRPYIDEVVLECEKCGGKSHRIPEIFDSWVEAGSMPFAEYHYPFAQKEIFESRYPAQFVAEYIAQTRAWFYVMHVIGFNLFGKAPFENVITTGTIMAEDRTKLSKSKKNYPDPWKIMDKYSVDALRFFLMNSAVMNADNMNFSERELGVVYRKDILILWNIYNYFVTYANEAAWQPNSKSEIRNLKSVIDQWINVRTKQLVNEAAKHLDNYDTVRYTNAIEGYISDLSTWYLRRSRGRKDGEFFETLRHCLLNLSKVMAPVTPYISEVIFQNLNRRPTESVHLAAWPESEELTAQEIDLLVAMDIVREAATVGLAARKQLKLNVRQPLSRLSVDTKSKDIKFTPELLEILLSELNVKQSDSKLVLEAKTNNKIFGFQGSKNIEYFYLDTTVDEQLKLEGLARQLEREVQEMRKNLGLRVGEVISLSYDTEDEELKEAMRLFDKSKTYVREVRGVGEVGEEHEIDGKKIRIKLSNE